MGYLLEDRGVVEILPIYVRLISFIFEGGELLFAHPGLGALCPPVLLSEPDVLLHGPVRLLGSESDIWVLTLDAYVVHQGVLPLCALLVTWAQPGKWHHQPMWVSDPLVKVRDGKVEPRLFSQLLPPLLHEPGRGAQQSPYLVALIELHVCPVHMFHCLIALLPGQWMLRVPPVLEGDMKETPSSTPFSYL